MKDFEVILSEYIDKTPDFLKMSQSEKIKHMAFFHTKAGDSEFTPADVLACFELGNLRMPSRANFYVVFNMLVKMGILIPSRIKGKYQFERHALKEFETQYSVKKQTINVSKCLREFLDKIKNQNQASFLKEVIYCYDVKAYRASIVMAWILCMDNLYDYVFSKKLKEFNSALSRRKDTKIKTIKNKDDLCELKESSFIEICRSSGIITNDVRKILDEKLGFRNSCAHPSGIKVKESKVTSFIEDIMDNIVLIYK